MHDKRMFVNTIAFVDELRTGKLQQEFFRPVREAGFDGIEVRREFVREFPTELITMQNLARNLELNLYYSVPDWLYRAGVLQFELFQQYIREAEVLGAKMLKLSVGEFSGTFGEELIALRKLVSGFSGIVTIENDQTSESGKLSVNLQFLRLCRDAEVPIFCTFDLGNWYWVHEDPIVNVDLLKEFTRSIHLKNVEMGLDEPKVTGLEEGTIDWRSIVKGFSEKLPMGLEYPCGPNAMDVLTNDLAMVRAYNPQ